MSKLIALGMAALSMAGAHIYPRTGTSTLDAHASLDSSGVADLDPEDADSGTSASRTTTSTLGVAAKGHGHHGSSHGHHGSSHGSGHDHSGSSASRRSPHADELNARFHHSTGAVVRTLDWDGCNVSDAHLLSPEMTAPEGHYGGMLFRRANFSASWLRHDLPIALYMHECPGTGTPKRPWRAKAPSTCACVRARHGVVVAPVAARGGCAWPSDGHTLTSGLSQYDSCDLAQREPFVRQRVDAAAAVCSGWKPDDPQPDESELPDDQQFALQCCSRDWEVMATMHRALAMSEDQCTQRFYGVNFNEVQVDLMHEPHVLDAIFYVSFAPPVSDDPAELAEWKRLQVTDCLRARELVPRLASRLTHELDGRDPLVQLNLPYKEVAPHVARARTFDWAFINGTGAGREHIAVFGPPVC